jgi:hypothetical protein
VRHTVNSFVDGSVAAGDQDQIGTAIDGAAGDLTGMAGAAGGDGIDNNPGSVQQFDGARERIFSPSECASVRIINQYGLPVGCDNTLIIIDVRANSRALARMADSE